MEDFWSKYSGEQVEEMLDQIANGEIGGGIETETDPIFSASAAASITEEKKAEWDAKQDTITDLATIREGASLGTTALQFVPSEYITETELTNKGYVTTSKLDEKVDKVSGKQLSTEDFTTVLKTKLEGLSNYDDTELSNALSTLRGDFDKLVSGDTTTAIKTFNEVIAFLDGIQDSQDLSSIIASIEQQIAGKMDKVTLATVATSGSYNDLSNKPTIPTAVTESTVSEWGFAKSSDLQSKAEDTSVVHKNGNETITGVKTFNGRVNFLGSGDSNAMYLSTNTRLNVDGTTNTVLGFSSGTFLINNAAYNLTLRGKGTRPTYNSTTLALSSDIPAAVTENTVSGWGFTKNTGTYSKPSGGIPKSDLASAVQASLGKADTALQSYTEQYKGTVTGVKVNGTTKNPSSGVVDLGTVVTDISGKQDKLVSGTNIKTINGTSLLGSGDIVISGGSSSGGSGAYSEVNHGTSDTTFTLTPNTFHVWDEVGSLTLTLGSETEGVANEFLFQFTSGATATSLTLPDDIKWNERLTIDANRIYQISILKGLASIMSWENANTALIENHITYDEGDFMNGGTITFEYPTASELTFSMDYYHSDTLIVPQGSTQVNIDWNEPSAPIIRGVSPAEDSTYKYIL